MNMVEFSFTESDLKQRIKAITIFKTKVILIIGCIAFVLMIYFLPIGYLEDAEFLINGYSLLIIAIIAFSRALYIFVKCRNAVFTSFTKTSKNNILNFNISKNNEYIKVICLETNKEVEFKMEDIKKMMVLKKIIVIELKSNEIIDFPNTEEIIKFFR